MTYPLLEALRMKADAEPYENQVFRCGEFRITVITPQLIRIEQGTFTDEATLTVVHRKLEKAACETGQEHGCFFLKTAFLTLTLDASLPPEKGLVIRNEGSPAFRWHFGEKPRWNLGGTAVTLDGTDGECAIGDGVCALDGFAVLDDSNTPVMLKDGWFASRQPGKDIYFFGYGHRYTRCVQDYCLLTGRVPMLPAYALGNWWSRYYAYSQEEYLALLERFEKEDIPLSTAVLDMDWHVTAGEGRPYRSDFLHDGWTGFTWNEALFPDYRELIRDMHRRGLHLALNLHPAGGIRSHERQYEEAAKAMGLNPEEKSPIPFNSLDPLFLSTYFEKLLFPYEEDGVDFWWIDWQQGNDLRRIAGEAYCPHAPKSISPNWMLNHMHYLASVRNGRRGLIFSRNAGFGSQRYPIGFSGDTYMTWESLRFQPYFTATAANIGYGWWSHDIGGHMGGVRDDELMVRWVQFGVFSPIFRLHSSNSPFNRREPWTFNPRCETVIARFMRLRHQLFPYLYTMNRRVQETQIPLILPMYHTHPEEKDAYRVPNQYWFGTEMIAAPVCEPADGSGLAKATVFFPEGIWTDFFSGVIYHGGQTLAVCRPLEEMPLFLKAGAIVPLQAHCPGSRKLGGAKEMELLVAPGKSGHFDIWEDDGETDAWRDGIFCRTSICFAWTKDKAVLEIERPQETHGLIPVTRRYTIHFIGFSSDCVCRRDGNPMEASYELERSTVTVAAEDSGGTIRISIEGRNGLIRQNRDLEERCMDRLMRAQMPMEAKGRMYEKLKNAVARMREGKRVSPGQLGSDGYTTLGLALFELIMQGGEAYYGGRS